MTKENIEIINKIKFELEKIKPKLAIDGGSIEFINFKDGIVKVRLLGECATCEIADITMKHAVEATLIRKIPAVKKVINVKLNII